MDLTVQELLNRLRENYISETDEDQKEKLFKDILTINSRRQDALFENMVTNSINEWLSSK